MKRASVFYIAVFLVLSIATVSANNDHDTELDDLHSLIIYFAKLKTSNKLPGLEIESKGKLTVYKIKENMHIEPYVYDEMVDEIKSCNNLYLIDATNDDKNLKYFFCKSINRSFVLMVSYKNINGEWQHIE